MKRPIVLGNWKMNKLRGEARSFCEDFLGRGVTKLSDRLTIGIAPPYSVLQTVHSEICASSEILLGAQNCHWEDLGAHTGEVSPSMLKELGVQFVVVGHSDRRQFYGDTDQTVLKRAQAAIEHGLIAVVCVGETEAQYRAGETAQVVSSQIEASLSGLTPLTDPDKLIVAYEPIWAIGTGLTATPAAAEEIQALIKAKLLSLFNHDIAVLYGGSTKPENVHELVLEPSIDGSLVGGASLKPDVFHQLCVNCLSAG